MRLADYVCGGGVVNGEHGEHRRVRGHPAPHPFMTTKRTKGHEANKPYNLDWWLAGWNHGVVDDEAMDYFGVRHRSRPVRDGGARAPFDRQRLRQQPAGDDRRG